MLYVLPPPRAPEPPSPWESILCSNGGSPANGVSNTGSVSAGVDGTERPPWSPSSAGPNRKAGLRVKLRNFNKAATNKGIDDSLGLNGEDVGRNCKSLSECYFAGKGTALVLPEASEISASSQKSNRHVGGVGNGTEGVGGAPGGTGATGSGCNIQKHLQSMFYLLRPEETLKMAVKLESVHPVRTRYLVVVSRMGLKAEESCLLGIDCNERTTVGLVLRVLADTTITLDGDGGFSVAVCGRHHIFKPVSVQAMWSALQTLHKVSSKARDANYYQQSTPNPPGLISSSTTSLSASQTITQTTPINNQTTNTVGSTTTTSTTSASVAAAAAITHGWVSYYEARIESDRSCLNEWHAMDNLESRRPPSPDSVRTKPTQREDTERVIRTTLKEIMMSVDLDEVTSKYIRSRLEEDLDMDLGEYKSFIDAEMLVILGQMDAPTEIFEHVYLGSEWNASNYEELQRNGVGHILNVTREIDNFFPGTFDYLNIRVYDDEKTDLLKYWDDTFKYISRAKDAGSKVLVHCKMGVSRSASVVIAYAMKAYNWNFSEAMDHVKRKRSCIKPNTSFLSQLETYQGILDAMKNKEKLQRSKSESNLKSPGLVAKNERALVGSNNEPTATPNHKVDNTPNLNHLINSGGDLRSYGERPKSWSPENNLANILLTDYNTQPPVFLSLENIHDNNNKITNKPSTQQQLSNKVPPTATSDSDSLLRLFRLKLKDTPSARNVLLPCDNGESYSVSPNQIVHLPGQLGVIASVRDRVSEFEGHFVASTDRKKQLCLNLTPLFENRVSAGRDSKDGSGGVNVTVSSKNEQTSAVNTVPLVIDNVGVLINTSWDPGEKNSKLIANVANAMMENVEECDSDIYNVPVTTVQQKGGDMLLNYSDRDEKKIHKSTTVPNVTPIITSTISDEDILRESPSRQSSWSSIDSAVILGYQGEKREGPSRNSSWGSVDARTLPSRNSSWGSYDIRCSEPATKSNDALLTADNTLEELNRCNFGTVKRTRQKLLLDDSATVICEAVNSVLSDKNSSAINIIKQRAKQKTGHIARLSVSAPEPSTMELVPTDFPSLSRSASKLDNVEQTAGIVRNLKREFEAKTKADQKVATMNMNNSFIEPIVAPEDKFKSLIDKFEVQPEENRVIQRAKIEKPYKNNSSRYSCIELSVEKSPIRITQTSYNSKREKSVPDNDYKRPPKSPAVRNNVAPNMVVTAFPFLAKDTKKQQQYGKTHPLAKLHFKQRSHPVYNTM